MSLNMKKYINRGGKRVCTTCSFLLQERSAIEWQDETACMWRKKAIRVQKKQNLQAFLEFGANFPAAVFLPNEATLLKVQIFLQ